MLADRLSLAASSLASEKREVVCKLACLYQRIVPITCSTTTSPPGGRPLHESDSSRGGLSNRGQKSIQSLGLLAAWALRLGRILLLEMWSKCKYTFALLS
jgi:hypothetical protein